MTRPRLLSIAAVIATLVLVGGAYIVLSRRAPSAPAAAAGPAANPEPGDTRKIRARLFYVGEDGLTLVPVDREVAYGEDTATQARRIIEAQLEPVAAPLVSAIPPGVTLRALYTTDPGQAIVDVSGEMRSAHPGGSLNETLTVYTIVNALTTNLPAIAAVQILVDGRQAETLAGHVDLRGPLGGDARWIATPPAPQDAATATETPHP